ncbi:hypothetical protein Pla110_15060 [Polystyrenella longa]|uniref:Uncharacterized protein n=1 Tax=Polystyrenella longa TaxID=2528007 RepID=A0A518CKP4_9PLAN|nr:hypothetical protein [Polystyrenella longa]QDU79792.1 hypothetical protein Pla110_15060 [Polystyrenella longa]
MNRLIWKELRENWKWGVVLLGLQYLLFWYFTESDKGSFYFEDVDFLSFVLILASLTGFAFGLIQTYSESAQDRWAFLVHRSVTPVQIANSKLIVGATIQALCWLVLIVSKAVYLSFNHYFNHPFYWFTIIPTLLASLAFLPAYAMGLLVLIWKPRRYLVKPLSFGFVLLLWFAMMTGTQDSGWVGLWGLVVVLALFTPLAVAALYSAYRQFGELHQSALSSRLFLHGGIVVSLFLLFILGLQMVGPFFAGKHVAQRHQSEIWFGESGELYKHRYQASGYDVKIPHELYCFDDLSNPIATKKFSQNSLPQHIKQSLAEKLNENLVPAFAHGSLQTAYTPMVSYSAVNIESLPLARETLAPFPVNQSWPHSTSQGQLIVWFSKVAGLIYAYEKPVVPGFPDDKKYFQTAVVGRNGFFPTETPEVQSFGEFVQVSQSMDYRNYKTAEGVFVPQRITNDVYLLVTAEAIYTINSRDREVNQIYTSSEQFGSIKELSLQIVDNEPLMLIEHEKMFRLFSTEKVESASQKFEDDQPAYISYIHMPDKVVQEFMKPKSLLSEEVLNVAYLSSTNRLIFATQENVSSMGAEPDAFSVFELQENGERLKVRQFSNELMNPPSASNDPTGYVMVFMLPVVVVGLFVSQITLIDLLSGVETGVLVSLFKYEPLNILMMVFAPIMGAFIATLLGRWYCKRQQFSPALTRFIWWTTVLLGPLGLVAVWLIETPPHRIACGNCGKLSTTEELQCRHCGKPTRSRKGKLTDIISPELKFQKLSGEKVSEPQPV